VKIFPIKKRINTELFIDGKQGLYKQKKRRVCIKKISDLSEEGKPKWQEIKCRNENAGLLFGMTYIA